MALFLAVLIPWGNVFPQGRVGHPHEYDDDDLWDYELPLMEGEGITIVGSKSTTQQMEIIDRETIEKTHAPDLPSLLEEAAGLGITRYGPYGNRTDVNIRGFNTKRTAVLIDGIPVNSAASGEFDFNSIDLASIERIEIIHGGSDTKYNVSGALGGVINIVTVKKQKPGWIFGGGLSNTSYLPGEYNSPQGGVGSPQWQDLGDAQNVNIFGAYGRENNSFRAQIFANRAGNHFLYQDYFGYARRKEGNEIIDAGTSLSFIQEFPDLIKLIVTGAFYWGDKNIPVSGYSTVYAEQRDMVSRETIMLDMPRAFHDDFSMELSLGHNWQKIDYDPGNIPSRHDEHDLSLINRWGWHPTTGFTLRFGGDYNFISLDSTDTGIHNGHRGGLYISTEYFPVKKLLLIASIKGISNGREIVPIPKFGLSWTLNDYFILKNNYFRSFKFPDFNDLYWKQGDFTGNPDLKNEDGWGADLGLEILHKDSFNLNSTIYGAWTEDSIHWSNISGSWRPENSGIAAFTGWDNRLSVSIPFSPGPLEKPILDLSWLYQTSWLLSGDLSFKDNLRIPYMPLHIFGASLELSWKTTSNKLPGSLLVSGRYESVRYADTRNITKLDPVFLLNFTYNQKLNKNFAVFGKIRNALNAQYVSFADYPMPGISMTLGINMVFGE
jgi:vitamin B12 transporter